MAAQMSRSCDRRARTIRMCSLDARSKSELIAVPFEWVAEREKGKNMDRLRIFCRSLAGGAILGIGVLSRLAQESVSVRAPMVKGCLAG